MDAQPIIGGIITQIFKECMQGVKTLATILSDEAKNRDIWGTAARTYEDSVRRRHNSMKILGMTRPIPLERIYTKVNLLEKVLTTQEFPDPLLSEFSSLRPVRLGIIRDTKPGVEAVDEHDKIMIVGKPGSGKTTFVKYLALQAISGKLSNSYVPIFLSLHDVSISHSKLREEMDNEFIVAGLRGPSEFVTNLLKSGKCLILLDGLDEVSEDRNDAITREIINLSEEFYLNKYVVTCRTGVYYKPFHQFVDMEVADFGEPEIRTFVQNWFSEDSDSRRPNDCTNIIVSHPPIQELASTPLLLTLLCLAYQSGSPLLQVRFQMYNNAVEELLEKWDERRRIRRDRFYKSMVQKLKLALLSYVAAVTFEQEEYFFPRARLAEVVAFLQSYTEVDQRFLEDEAQGVIDAIEAHHGLFIRQSKDVYSFSHLTLQEFFTALYVREKIQRHQELVHHYLGSRRWREVLIAVAHLLGDADDYVMCILYEMVSMGFLDQYFLLLKAQSKREEVSKRGITGKRRSTALSTKTLGVDVQGAINETEIRKAQLTATNLRPHIQSAGLLFAEKGLERYFLTRAEEEGRSSRGAHFIPVKKTSQVVSEMRGHLDERHQRRLTSIDEYAKMWIEEFQDVCNKLGIELSASTVPDILARLKSGIDLEIQRVSSYGRTELVSIEVAETLIEILSTAVISTNTRGAAIKTLHSWRRT